MARASGGGGANNMHSLSWRGINGKDPTLLCKKIARAPGGV